MRAISIALLLACLAAGAAGAQDKPPSKGLMPHTKEHAALNYSCWDVEEGIACELIKMKAIKMHQPGLEQQLKTEKNAARKKAIRDEIASSAKACIFFAETSFKRFRRESPKSDRWVSQDGPFGPCGVMSHARFELEKLRSGEHVWSYESWYTMTKPSAERAPGESCGPEVDDRERYDWNYRTLPMTCSTIQFGAFN